MGNQSRNRACEIGYYHKITLRPLETYFEIYFRFIFNKISFIKCLSIQNYLIKFINTPNTNTNAEKVTVPTLLSSSSSKLKLRP